MNKKQIIRRQAIFSFGENINDAKVLKELVLAIRKDLPIVEPKMKPIILRRNADLEKLRQRTNDIVRMLKAAQVVCDVVAVIAHRDLDNVEPADSAEDVSQDEESLRTTLREIVDLGVQVVVTSPAWEMEAWWLMWPDQVAQHRPSWKKLRDRSGKRVDRIVNAKEVLKRESRPVENPKVPPYSETDGPYIASIIRKDGQIRLPRANSIAFTRFLLKIDAVKFS